MTITKRSPCFALVASCCVGLGACVTTSNDLGDAAYRLDRSADALSDEVRDAPSSALRRDAHQLAEIAEDFNGDVRERLGREELRERFERVADRYHDVRDELEDQRSASARERTAFNDVTRAYLDLERELQYRGPRERRD